jgi:phosphate transport system substrate-binding protein
VPEAKQPTLDDALPHYVPRTDIELSGHFKGAASDVLAMLTQNWIAAFRKYYPKVTLDVPPPYAGSLGALELIKGDLQFVMVSRELKPTDVSGFQAKFGYAPFSAPVCGGTYRHFGFLDAMAFIVHADNPLKQLTYDQIDAIYSSTHHRGGAAITTWGQLGLSGDWADKPIHVWGVKPWNGFEEFIRQRILSVGTRRGEWRTDLHFTDTVFPISPAVAGDRYALGYSGLAYIGDGVRLVPISSDGGPAIPPSYEEVIQAHYPLSRLVFFNTNKRPGQPLDPVLAEFLKFILSREGQQVVLDQGIFIPLRANQADVSRSMLQPQ